MADAEAAAGRNLPDIVRRAVSGGVTLVQLRAKRLSTRDFFHLAEQIRTVLETTPVPLIINDRVDVARAAGADGVHLGQDDLPLEAARRLLGPDSLIGLTVHNSNEARTAASGGADLLGVGPAFPTSSKPDVGPVMGCAGIHRIRESAGLPILGIGGINAGRVSEVIAAGADGVAVISAIISAPDPADAARALRLAVDNALADSRSSLLNPPNRSQT